MQGNRGVALVQPKTPHPSPTSKPLTPGALNALYESAAVGAVERYVSELQWLVSVEGEITAIPESSYEKVYKASIGRDGEQTGIVLSKKLIQARGLAVGDYVVLQGRLSTNIFRGQLEFRLEVVDAQHVDSPAEVARKKRDVLTLQRVKAMRLVRRPVPFKHPLKVSVIAPGSGQVRDDFEGALGTARKLIELESIDVTISNPFAVAQAIGAAQGDIVVLIRGGGSPEELALLDSEAVLEAFASKDAYRMVGVGHTPDNGIVDMVVDHAAPTPTAAGTFIAQQIEALLELVDDYEVRLVETRRGAKETAEGLSERIKGLEAAAERQAETLGTTKEQLRAATEDKGTAAKAAKQLQEDVTALRSSRFTAWVWAVGFGCLSLLLLLWLLTGHRASN